MSGISTADLAQTLPSRGERLVSDVAGVRWNSSLLNHLVERLGPNEVRRRLLHMLPGLLPALLWIIPHTDPWGIPLIFILLTSSAGIALLAFLRQEDFARPGETGWYYSMFGYGAPTLAMLLFLPGRSELGLLTFSIVAFGDGSAALGGKAIGGYPLPWNRNKTWTGLSCFLLAGTIMATINYWTESRPSVPLNVALGIASVAALAAALVESLPIRSHDNLRVGVTAGLVAIAMQSLLIGW